MKLNNANTSSNEALAVRASVLSDLRDDLSDMSPFTQALLAVGTSDLSTTSDTPSTFFKEIWNSIQQKGNVEGIIGVDSEGNTKNVTLSAMSYIDVNQGDVIVDIFLILVAFGDQTATLGYQNDRYINNNGVKGDYRNSVFTFTPPSFLSEDEIDEYLESFAQQIGAIDVLVSLSNMAISGPVSYSDVMSVIQSSGSFINAKLHGIVSQYATYLNPENACAIINLMISDYFNTARGYEEDNGNITFNSLEYEFDSSCLLGWHQVTGIVTSAVSIVATIFNPIAGFILGTIGSVISSVGEFITNADGSTPKVVPEAAHNIASLPVWQGEMTYNRFNWAHRFISKSGRLTLTTDFFKLFAWLQAEDTLALEMYVNTGYSYDIVEQWRNGRSAVAPSGAVTELQDLLHFSTTSDARSFQTLTFPDGQGGSWDIPSIFGDQSLPSDIEESDILYSRIYNGLLLCSLYVVYSSNSSITMVSQTRSNSLPDSYTPKDRLLWYIGAYMDTYKANLIDSSLASWLVPGWFTALRDFSSTLTADAMLHRFVDTYFYGSGTQPSIVVQDYGKAEGIRSFLTPTITSKGSAMIIPPSSQYSIGQKLAVTAGVAAVVAVGGLVASMRFRSTQARNAQNQRIKVNTAFKQYTNNPSMDTWNAFYKQVRTYNRWTFFNGATRISAADWGSLNTPVLLQSAASSDTALKTLLSTDAVSDVVSNVATRQIPSLSNDNVVTQTILGQLAGDSETVQDSIDVIRRLIKPD